MEQTHYYDMDIYSAGAADNWGDRISMSITGASYEDIIKKVKELGIDINDTAKWEVNLYYRRMGDHTIDASCVLLSDANGRLCWYYNSVWWFYDGKDPIPKAKELRKA
jgi:hypothetical protein